jgi:hypothetical protein
MKSIHFILTKKIFISLLAISITSFIACNNSDKSSKQDNASKMNADTVTASTTDTSRITEVNRRFNDLDPKLASSLKIVVDHYLHIKNALVNNSGSDAADGGKEMANAIGKVDKSLFTADQKKVYNDIEGDLKENAEHIGGSATDIEHQREHFVMMSKDVYGLVKAFGDGKVLYHDHCPMANDNNGALWLSETKEIKNPYFGGKMNGCSKVEEVIKN